MAKKKQQAHSQVSLVKLSSGDRKLVATALQAAFTTFGQVQKCTPDRKTARHCYVKRRHCLAMIQRIGGDLKEVVTIANLMGKEIRYEKALESPKD